MWSEPAVCDRCGREKMTIMNASLCPKCDYYFDKSGKPNRSEQEDADDIKSLLKDILHELKKKD